MEPAVVVAAWMPRGAPASVRAVVVPVTVAGDEAPIALSADRKNVFLCGRQHNGVCVCWESVLPRHDTPVATAVPAITHDVSAVRPPTKTRTASMGSVPSSAPETRAPSDVSTSKLAAGTSAWIIVPEAAGTR